MAEQRQISRQGIAGPEILATTPRMEKIPAPIMPPTPMLRAATSPIFDFFVSVLLVS
jgi:hypothetical protein